MEPGARGRAPLHGDSYDNTGGLGANTWRHVAFIEQDRPLRVDRELTAAATAFRWLMSSDVCKHCTHSACLDVCPTGAIFRTELGTVVVQEDVCNGCGYCVPAARSACSTAARSRTTGGCGSARCATTAPGRASRRRVPRPARPSRFSTARSTSCASARPGGSSRSWLTASTAHVSTARTPTTGLGGFGAFFLLLDEPRGLRPAAAPVDTTRDLPEMWRSAAAAAAALALGPRCLPDREDGDDGPAT